MLEVREVRKTESPAVSTNGVDPQKLRIVDMNAEADRAIPIRSRTVSQRELRLLLGSVDLAILIGGVAYARFFAPAVAVGPDALPTFLTGGVLVALVWAFMATATDLYDMSIATGLWRTHTATLCAALTVWILGSYYAVAPGGVLSPALAVVASIGVWRAAFAVGFKAFNLRHRILLIGANQSAVCLAESIDSDKSAQSRGYEIVGIVSDDLATGQKFGGLSVLGSTAETLDIVGRENIDMIVLAEDQSSRLSPHVLANLLTVRELGLPVLSMPKLYEAVTQKVAVEHTGTTWGILFPMEECKPNALHDALARGIDIVAGLLGCIICAIFVPFVLVINKIGNQGPLLYSQIRVGKGGLPYRIFKFRSMVTDAEKHGAVWAQSNDPRVTKIGKFLRKTRIDELPQFWNVLVGDMAFIGPRPERPEFVEQLGRKIPFYRTRNAVKPGLTGWAQVMYRYGASEDDALIKLRYDLYYIKNRSLALDLKIVFRTIATVLFARGQ